MERQVKRRKVCKRGPRSKRSVCIPSEDDIALKEESISFNDDVMKVTIYDKNNPSIEVRFPTFVIL